MKLITAKISPFAARCRMLIYAKGIHVEFLEYPVDISKEELSAINPVSKIPTLIDGDLVIPESDTICVYLEERFLNPTLMPETPAERAQMRLLCRIADLYVMTALTPLFAHLSRRRRDQVTVDAGIALVQRGLHSLEQFIDNAGFAVGQRLSIADCSLAPILYFLTVYLPFFDIDEPFSKSPNVQAYWHSIKRDPYAARVIEEIHQGIQQKSAR